MNVLKFEVYKNTLKRRDGFNPVLGEKNYTKIKCYFVESDWDKCTAVTANFMSDKDNIVKSTVSLTTDDKTAVFDIPSGLEGDKICFSLTGSYADDSGNTVTLNTNLVGINRQKGMLPSETVDFGLYEQMLSLYNKMNGLYNQLKNEKISKSEGSVVTAYLADGAVTTTKLADNSVNDEKLSERVKSVLNSVPDKANLNDICNIVPSKNLIVLTDGTYTNKNINNATVTVKDNKISIKSDGAVGVSGAIYIPARINLKEETECCLSTQDTINNESLTDTNPLISLYVNAVKLVDITMSQNGNVMSKVLNVSSDTNCEIRITLAKDKTYDIESKLQLEKGTVATNFESPTNVKKILSLSLAENSVSKSNLTAELQNGIVTYNTLYVTTDLSKVDNIKTFASILAANNSIKDNDEKNRYIIKVANGEYHDLETTYAGSTDTTQLQGIIAKDYVYYESESNEPAKCVLVWNGAVGFSDLSLLTNDVALKKCIFHITGGDYTERGLHTHIKGFTLRSLNTRYGLHCESGGYGRNVDWFADNCIIEFGGRPQVGDGTSNMPVIGMGVSPHQKGLFKRCSFKYINGASGNTINCHDNAETTTYKTAKAVINGAEIVFDGCNFNGGLLNFVSTNTSDTPYVAQIKNSKVDDGNITYTDNWIIKNKSTTLAGYGITDAYTKERTDQKLAQKLNSMPFDSEPTNNSPCYLTSGTVYNSLLTKADKTETDNLLGKKANNAEVDDVKAYIGYTDSDILGLQVDFENKTFKRLAGAVGLSANSDFDKFTMYGGRRRCNVSDDGTITAYYGDENYAEDGSNGQVMVYQPAFYYKVVPLKLEKNADSNIGYHLRRANYYVSSKPKTGFKLHPAFYDENGNPVNYILFSADEGSMYDVSAKAYVNDGTNTDTVIEAGDLLCSVANVKPISGLKKPLNKVNLETMAQNRGSGWHLETIKATSANQLLMMIELGIMSTQNGIGQGVVSITGDTAYNCSSLTGSTAELGNSTGQAKETVNEIGGTQTAYTESGKVSVTYRGVENPWGNISKHIQGINIWGDGSMGGGQPYVANNFAFNESKHSDNYEPVGFTLANANGYIKAMGYGSEKYDWLFMPSEIGGTSALPVGDIVYNAPNLNGYRIIQQGGNCRSGDRAGSFSLVCNGTVGDRSRGAGGRLMYVPTAKSGDTPTKSYTAPEVDSLLSNKYDSSNIELGTATLTPYSTQIDKIKSATCLYEKIGDIVIVNVTVIMNATSLDGKSSISLLNMPFSNKSDVIIHDIGISKNGGMFRGSVTKSAWLQFTPLNKQVYNFVADEQVNFSLIYKI